MFKSKTINAGMNAKTIKSDKASDYVTAILYMAPAKQVEGINVCPMAELAGCAKACLFTAGRGAMSNVQKSRINKTIRFRDDRKAFIKQLDADIKRFTAWCAKRGKKPAVRLNGTSDIAWETIAPELFSGNPDVQFYDYTKIAKRVEKALPDNYHLTLSFSYASGDYAHRVIRTQRKTGCNIAVVFRNKATRDRYMSDPEGFPQVIDGDKTDLRFLDPQGVTVGLYAKGSAKQDETGFVVD